jgi:transcription initiation factor TFIIB
MVQIINQITKTDFDNDNSLLFCIECNGPIISDDYRGETLCEACGLIHSEKACDTANFGKIMYSIQDINRRSHYGDPQSIFTPGIDLSTFIESKGLHDFNLKRIAKVDFWFKSENYRAMPLAIRDFKRISYNLKLPLSIVGQGLYLYKKAHKLKLMQGRDSISFVCSCLYYACRRHELPITLNDILNECNVKAKKIKNAYRLLYRTFNLKVRPLTPQHFVSRYINELGLGLQIEKEISKVISQLPYNFINGQNPKRICAGAIYLVCKKHKLKTYQKEIAKVCDVSEVSVRYTWKEISRLVKI